MAFIDTALVQVSAGRGGNGMVSFRREPYVARGGPDGGDGGKGGNVVFEVDGNLNTLAHFRHKQLLVAEDGKAGARAKRHGKSGEDLIVKVPVGTTVLEAGELLYDLVEPGQRQIVATGGKGGFGNAHFTSSRRQAPSFAEKGEPGQAYEFSLELKLLADVGLVGLPNAGKSTLLSVVSKARPKIADYPFTTLQPYLGVADVDDSSILIADIPGLIEGAAQGKGLGRDFLRHVERTAVLVHLIDAYSDTLAEDYQVIQDELAQYDSELSRRVGVVALTKTEGFDQELIDQRVAELRSVVPKDIPIIPIAAIAHQGLVELLRMLVAKVATYREQERAAAILNDEAANDTVPVIGLDDSTAWLVQQEASGQYRVTGEKIERFAMRTDFENDEAVARLRDIFGKMGIEKELFKLGAQVGDRVVIGPSGRHGVTL